MTIDEATLDEILRAVPARPLPESTRERALKLARAQLSPVPDMPKSQLSQQVLATAAPAALISADLVFLIDACCKMGRGFGG